MQVLAIPPENKKVLFFCEGGETLELVSKRDRAPNLETLKRMTFSS